MIKMMQAVQNLPEDLRAHAVNILAAIDSFEASVPVIERTEALQCPLYAMVRCEVLNELGPRQWVAEFGVFSGRTIHHIRNNTNQNVPVFGFDCFTGLPETWQVGPYEKGVFDMQGKIPDIPNNTTIVKGLFGDTLPHLQRVIGSDSPLQLLHIDCDLYAGAACALQTLKNNIVPGTVIIFDELLRYEGFENHEIKALCEYIRDTNCRLEVFASWDQQVGFRVL